MGAWSRDNNFVNETNLATGISIEEPEESILTASNVFCLFETRESFRNDLSLNIDLQATRTISSNRNRTFRISLRSRHKFLPLRRT